MARKQAKRGRFDRLTASIDRRTAPEARELRRALRHLGAPGGRVPWSRAYEVAERVIMAGDRTLARRTSDHHTDHARRVLVGERIPWEVAETYKAQAAALGWSMYRWTVEALALGYKCLMPKGTD